VCVCSPTAPPLLAWPGLACLYCNNGLGSLGSLVLSHSLCLGLGLGPGSGRQGCAREGPRPMAGLAGQCTQQKSALAQEGRQRKIDSGDHSKIEALHCNLACRPVCLSLFSLCHPRSLPPGFPSRCLLALGCSVCLAGWVGLGWAGLAAQACAAAPHDVELAHRLVDHT
jgi:hypothetical protein